MPSKDIDLIPPAIPSGRKDAINGWKGARLRVLLVGRSSRNRNGFMDRECPRLLDFMEIGPGGIRERFLVGLLGLCVLARNAVFSPGTASWYASAAGPWIRDRAWKNGKELLGMEDLLERFWHGNNRKQ